MSLAKKIAIAIGIITATFVSEDLACIGAGMKIHAGTISATLGVVACVIGIFLGDLGLWLLGRLSGAHLLNLGWVKKRVTEKRLARLSEAFDRRGWQMVIAARFFPGTRFPVYVGAGMLGRKALRFAIPALVAGLIWTPALVLLVAKFGGRIVKPIERYLGEGWIALLVAIVLLFLAIKLVQSLLTRIGRLRWLARIARIWRWEFWPLWLFYLPLVPYIFWLALRHRGFMTITAANPGIPHSGIVGESKHEILQPLAHDVAVRTERIDDRAPEARIAKGEAILARDDWKFPVIVKPDAGQRGAGVRLARDYHALHEALREHDDPVLLQEYHAGPYEAGIFYVRRPGESQGTIFSITDKHPPVIEGDGASTIEELIWNDPRLRMQAKVFLQRWAKRRDDILHTRERLILAVAGNHCQGTKFADGAHLITPELTDAIHRAVAPLGAFHFGRLDVRYADADELRAGRGFKIIEVNGATSESTNVYDPSWSLLRAYRVLARQWRILFEIGAENRRRGVTPTPVGELLREVRRYYRERDTSLLSD